jgi:hypothetical protein
VTAESLAAVGLPAQALDGLTFDAVRTSAKGKWHVAGDGVDRCQHLSRAYGYGGGGLPVQAVSVLGEYDWCSTCAHRVGLPGPAGVFLTAAGVIVAAARWVQDLERCAADMDWLAVSRWSSRTPFDVPDRVAALLHRLAGVRGWAKHRMAAQVVWRRLAERSEAAMARARQAAGPPGLRALAARARDVVYRDVDTRGEAAALDAVAGYGHRQLYRPDLCAVAFDAWVAAVAADGDPRAGHVSMLAAVEAHFAGAVVRDVSLLPDPALTGPEGHTTPAAWATAEFRAVRARIVAGWCTRLDAALHGARPGVGGGERLLLVVGWPITAEPDREIAYLTQYPVVARTVVTARDADVHPVPRGIPWAVVLRVPAFAAEHAIAHRSDYLLARGGAATGSGAEPDDGSVRDLLRHAAGFLTEDTTGDPGELPPVTRWRNDDRTYHGRRLLAEPTEYEFQLPSGWRWVPDAGDEAAASAFLAQLCDVLRRGHQPMILRVAAGEPAHLTAVDLVVYPQEVGTDPTVLTYVPHELTGCPPVDVPLRRIISAADAR